MITRDVKVLLRGDLEKLLEGKTIETVEDYLPVNFILHLSDGVTIEVSGIPVLEVSY